MSNYLHIGIRWIAAIAIVLGLLAGATTVKAEVTCANPCDSAALTAAITAAAAGDIIEVPAGTFPLATNVNVNKDVTIHGAGTGASGTIFQVSGTGHRITLNSAGATLDNFEIVKTDEAEVQNIIGLYANNLTIQNLVVHGSWAMGDGEVYRALEVAGGLTGILIQNNTFYGLRQPGYLNASEITITGNYVYGTRGWVIAGANATFTGNTWGAGGQVNAVDIAILAGTNPAYYTDLLATSEANNNAVIEDQRTGVLTHVWVNDDALAGGNGYRIAPYTSIQDGINRAVAGGTVNVAAGIYLENDASYRDLVINKSINLIGAGKNATFVQLTEAKTNGVEIYGSGLDVAIERMTFTRRDGSTYGPDFGLRIGETASTFTNFYMNEVAVLNAEGRAVQFGAAGSYDYINIEDSDFNFSGAWGMSIDGPTSKLDIARSNFMNNGTAVATQGIGLDIGNGGISNVYVVDSDFSNNTMKGVNIVNTNTALFQRIKVNNTGPAENNSAFTMWEWGGGEGSTNITVAESEFKNNNRMAILLGSETGNTITDVTIMSSVFADNGMAHIFGWNEGTVSDIKIHHNSLLGTGEAISNNQTSPVFLAENNWFGCNEGPGQPGCSTVSAGVDADPWLVLKVDVENAEVQPGGSTPVTASLNFNNLGVDTSAAGRGFFPDGVTINFTAEAGTVDPTSDTTFEGEANTTYTADNTSEPHSVCAVLDNETTCVDVNVTADLKLYLPIIFR